MKIKWSCRKLTFMMIPEEANRSVTRHKIPVFLVYLIPLLALVLISITLFVYILHTKSAALTRQMQIALNSNLDLYKDTVSDKDKAIAELQNKVVSLSQQAQEVKSKLDELTQLESDIKSLRDGVVTSNSKPDKPANIVTLEASEPVGGDMISISEQEIDQLISDTEASLTHSSNTTEGLFEGLTDAKKVIVENQYLLQVTPSLWPTNSLRVTSIFGYRKDPFTNRPSLHSGVDIAGNSGDPVYVTADGIVQYTGRDSSHGNNIIVKHANGLSTRYMHLKKILIEDGAKVLKGTKIGLLGTTGRSTGPHLHYEVIKGGQSIDPWPYLKLSGKVAK